MVARVKVHSTFALLTSHVFRSVFLLCFIFPFLFSPLCFCCFVFVLKIQCCGFAYFTCFLMSVFLFVCRFTSFSPRLFFSFFLKILCRGFACFTCFSFSVFSFLSLLKCCFTFTETVGLLGTGAQDVHLDFHTAPELCISFFSALLVCLFLKILCRVFACFTCFCFCLFIYFSFSLLSGTSSLFLSAILPLLALLNLP